MVSVLSWMSLYPGERQWRFFGKINRAARSSIIFIWFVVFISWYLVCLAGSLLFSWLCFLKILPASEHPQAFIALPRIVFETQMIRDRPVAMVCDRTE